MLLARVTTVILDADGVSKFVRRDRRVRAMLRREAADHGSEVVVPPAAIIQAMLDGCTRKQIDELPRPWREANAVDVVRQDLASSLLLKTSTADVPDALVAAEALLRVPAIVITSDLKDLIRLVGADLRGARVEVWKV